MKELLINLFGEYTPTTYVDSNGVSVIPDGLAGIDWGFVGGVALFAIVLLCLLKCVGGLLNK